MRWEDVEKETRDGDEKVGVVDRLARRLPLTTTSRIERSLKTDPSM